MIPFLLTGLAVNALAYALTRWAPFGVLAAACAAGGAAATGARWLADLDLDCCPHLAEETPPMTQPANRCAGCDYLLCLDCHDPAAASFDDYITAVGQTRARHPHWRRGQAAWNVLCAMRPRLAADIRGNLSLDVFYLDDNLAEFYGHVRDHWDDPAEPALTRLDETIRAAEAAVRTLPLVTLDEAMREAGL